MAEMEQLTVALPGDLVAFLRRRAKIEDRTPSGQIRHYVSEAARQEPPPEAPLFGSVLPNVQATPESIAEGKAIIADLRRKQARLANLKGDATAASDADAERYKFEAEIMESRVAAAVRQLPRPTNGGA